MLGKTHIAIGAMAGILLLPYMHIPVHHIQFTDSIANTLEHLIPQSTSSVQNVQAQIDQKIADVVGIVVSTIAALIPDLDCPHSKLSRDIAPISLGSRRITFLVLAALLWYLTGIGWIPKLTGIIFTVYLGIVAFLKHRGMTHSILGLVLSYLAVLVLDPTIAIAFTIGYASHILADMLTDSGVPLFWPYPVRIHIPTGLHTGSFIEKGIRLVAMGITAITLVTLVSGIQVLQNIHM